MITWTLTPGGDGECTVVRLAAELRDPDINARLGRRRARRALRQVYRQLLVYLGAYLAADAT